ncbi:hypothetical protein V9L05_08725 [Bernardetia sp. Wsw4-3y2]|uniref:hypothetical protein n=1 Tax=Bernardetia sp. Wsw4-3y2 TaxID=3127471 RepID=UPI0030D04703
MKEIPFNNLNILEEKVLLRFELDSDLYLDKLKFLSKCNEKVSKTKIEVPHEFLIDTYSIVLKSKKIRIIVYSL